jgi:hypothetical protein
MMLTVSRLYLQGFAAVTATFGAWRPLVALRAPMKKMRLFSLFIATFALLRISPASAILDGIPDLNLQPICRGIAEQALDPGEIGAPDLTFNQCIDSERKIRADLVVEWSAFAVGDKKTCVQYTIGGGLPSYSDLLGCLQMARDARKFSTPRDYLSISR